MMKTSCIFHNCTLTLILIATIFVHFGLSAERYSRWARRNLPNALTTTTLSPQLAEQCPCIRLPNSEECSSLDSSMVATSLEDAVLNFQRPRDFFLENDTEDEEEEVDEDDQGPVFSGRPPPFPGGQRAGPHGGRIGGSGGGHRGLGLPFPGRNTVQAKLTGHGRGTKKPKRKKGLAPQSLGSTMSCHDSSCKSCANYILKKLQRQTLQSSFQDKNKVMAELESMHNKFGSNSDGDHCDGLGFDFNEQPPQSKLAGASSMAVMVDKTEAKKLWQKITGGSSTEPESSDDSDADSAIDSSTDSGIQTGTGAYFIPAEAGRKRRQAEIGTVSETKTNSKFEIQYKIDCRKKGDAAEPNSPYMGLCGTCWEWGMLPERFYPKYINMMTCNTNTNCLSGYGKCRQRVRNIQVLENKAPDGQAPRYSDYSLTVPLCCDCQVKAGTALHNLVVG